MKNVYAYMGEKDPPNPPFFCDPLAIMALFRPDCVVAGMNVKINVQLKGSRTRGSTLIDFFGPESRNYNAYLVKEFNCDILIEETMKSYEN